MEADVIYSRSRKPPMQRPRPFVFESVGDSQGFQSLQRPRPFVFERVGDCQETGGIRISKRRGRDRESKQRRCIFCLLILIILLGSALCVAILLNFRTHCCCETTHEISNDKKTSPGAQMTSNSIFTPNVSTQTTLEINNDKKTSPSAQMTSNLMFTPNSTTQMVTKMSTEFTRGVSFSLNVQTTTYRISAQNKTIGSRGKGFVVLFMTYGHISTKNIYVTSENGVQINISTSPRLNATLKAQIDRCVNIPSSQHIIIPSDLVLQSFRKEVKSVVVETSADVFVISHDDGVGSVGSTTHIPMHKLSTKYVVLSTEPIIGDKSQFAVSAIQDNTMISITFKMAQNSPLIIDGETFQNGNVLNISLDRFETYQIQHSTDLTGTLIESSVPIAAFSGNDCNRFGNIGACDHLIEQLPPMESADKAYIVPPLSDERDVFIRITAIENSFITYTIGTVSRTRYMSKFDFFNVTITSIETCYITSKRPIFVTAFGLQSKNSTLGDPSMTIVPGLNQYLDYYKIVVPSGYDHNYVSIMMRYSSKYSFRINGTFISTSVIVFEENVLAGNVLYNVRSIRVVEGELTASTVNGERFGLMFAGVTDYEAYGFSGNSMLL